MNPKQDINEFMKELEGYKQQLKEYKPTRVQRRAVKHKVRYKKKKT